MTGALGEALARLAQEHALPAEQVERCDVGKDGGLSLEARDGARRRWFRFDGALVELRPELDRALPLAARIADLAAREPVRVLAWRPGRRIALAVGDGDARRAVKGLRRGREVAAAARHRHLARELLSRDIGVDAPVVLASDLDTASLTLSWLPQPPLRIRAHAADAWRQVGLVVRSLQELVPIDGLEVHGRAAELAVLDRMAARYVVGAGALPAGWRETRATLEARLSEVARPVLLHGDLHDGQLVSGGGRVGVLDLDGLAAGDSAQDLANLTAHLELRALNPDSGVSPADAAECGAAVLDGAGGFEREEAFARLRAHQAATFLRLALVHGLRPRWSRSAADLVPLARRCLDDVPVAP